MADQAKKLQVDVVARIDKLEKAMAKAAGVTDRQMGKVENRAKQMTGRLDAQFNKIGAGLKGGALAAIAGIGTGAAAALAPVAILGTALSTLGEMSGLVRLSERIGLSTTMIQVLGKQAQLVGIDINAMGDGLGDFAAKVAEASAGAGPLAEIFKANGVELKKQDGTLRSTRDILADFANLIQNARTPQEQLFLAQQAFGDEAGKLVPLFKAGARGLEEMERKAVSAGDVIDEQLVKRAAEIDKEFATMWSNFGTNAKSAILTAVDGLTQLRGVLRGFFADYEQKKSAALLGDLAGSMVGPAGASTTGTQPRVNNADARMAGALATELSAADAKLVAALQKRYGEAANKATIIPTGGGGGGGDKRNAEAERAIREGERVLEFIAALKEERSLIAATDVQRAQSNALRQAGAAATAEQRAEIETLVAAIYAEEEATEKAAEAAQELRDVGRDVLGGFIDDMIAGKNAADSLADALKNIGSRLINSGLDSLFGGGSGGSPLDFLFKGFEGFSSGGYTGPGGKNVPAGVVHRGEYVFDKAAVDRIGVGQLEAMRKGGLAMPEAIRAPVMPKIAAGGGGGSPIVVNFNPQIDARGASVEAVARLDDQMQRMKREIPSVVIQTVRGQQSGKWKM